MAPARPPLSPHWKRLGLIEGAPDCAIEAAWKWQIAQHHPDRGGDADIARAVNVARDELRGEGSKPNEYVARNYESQPWLVLGVRRESDPELARRVGAQLAAALSTHRRLAERVRWAIDQFGLDVAPPAGPPPRPTAAPARRPTPRRTAAERPHAPARPGRPEGLPDKIDLGTVEWGAEVAETVRLTWRANAPYEVHVEAPPPLTATVTGSKALPGRFVVTVAIDWQHEAFTHAPSLRGHTLSGRLRLRWGGGGEAEVPVRGVALYPAHVSVSPAELDAGTVDASARVRASLVLVSTGRASVEVAPPGWLYVSGGDGRERKGVVRLEPNVPVRVEFGVRWEPILERARTSFAAGRPVRPTGTIVLRWGEGRTAEVRAQMVVKAPRR